MKIIQPNHPLYLRYPSQSAAQPCELRLFCDDAVLTVAVQTEIGGRSMLEHSGRMLAWRVPCLTEDSAAELLGEVAPLAERVVAGYSRVWDGSNMVGEYTSDAQDASEEIALLCDRDREVERVYTADDWFAPLGDRATQRADLGIADGSDLDAIAACLRQMLADGLVSEQGAGPSRKVVPA